MGSGATCNSRWPTFYSPRAILTALTLRAVFRLAYRQAEGLSSSIISLLGLTLRAPDHTRSAVALRRWPCHGAAKKGIPPGFFQKILGPECRAMS
jgi:Transposase DDE domain